MARGTVLLIGGGVIGVCSAYYLARDGWDVTVVEKGEVCAGCSYGNAGLIVPSHSVPLAAPGVWLKGLRWMLDPESPFYIKPRISLDLAAWLWRFRAACTPAHVRRAMPVIRDLSYASLALYRELAAVGGLDFGFRRDGVVAVFRTEAGHEAGVEEARLLGEAGIPTKVLDRAAVHDLEPSLAPEVVGGVLYPDDAHLVPDRFVKGLARVAESKGVRIRTATEVLGFRTEGHRIVAVETTRGDLVADEVVLAAGSWSPGLGRALGLSLPIQPAKGYSVTYRRPADGPRIPLMLGEAKAGVTPMDDTLRFAGTLELAGLDLSVDRRRVNAIVRAAGQYLRGMRDLEVIEIWRGLRPCTPDGLPIIGRPGRFENLILATGHAMIGVSLGPVTGKLVSQSAAREPPAIDLRAPPAYRSPNAPNSPSRRYRSAYRRLPLDDLERVVLRPRRLVGRDPQIGPSEDEAIGRLAPIDPRLTVSCARRLTRRADSRISAWPALTTEPAGPSAMDRQPHSSARTPAAATRRRRPRARRWLRVLLVLALLGGSAIGVLDSRGIVDLGDWTRAGRSRTWQGARELAQTLSENLPVYRVQLSATTCDLPGAGTDNAVQVRLNPGNTTWLDYSQNDFERGTVFTYDLGLDNVSVLRDIAMLEISTDGADAWCLRDLELLVNNALIFARPYPPAGRWLSQGRRGRRALAFSGERLRSHPRWEGYRPSLPPNPIPRAELESRMESAVGNAIHGQPVTWRRLPGRAVTLERAGRLTYRGALELEARLDNWADPRIRVTFQLAISCRGGQLAMRVRKLDFDVDSPWYADAASFGMVDDKVEQRLRKAVEGLSLTRSTALLVCPPALAITREGDMKLY